MENTNTNQKDINNAKKGFALSIFSVLLEALFGFVVLPFVLLKTGSIDYGIYKSMASFCGSVAILDFGISIAVLRFVSSFHSKKDSVGAAKYFFVAIIQALIICALLTVVAVIFLLYIPTIYKNTLTSDLFTKTRIVFCVLFFNLIVTIFSNILSSVLNAYRKFQLSSLLSACSILFKILFTIVCFVFFDNIVYLACSLLASSFLFLLIKSYFVFKKTGLKPKPHVIEKKYFWQTFKFCLALFFQSIATLANGNVDNILIGVQIGFTSVSIYSFALQLLNIFEQCASLFSNISMPFVVESKEKKDSKYFFEICTRIGRIQTMILSPILVGFFLFGKGFCVIWLGSEFVDVYYLSLILFVPRFFELIINTNINGLKANDKLMTRSLILVFSMLLNIGLTIVGIIYFGYFGAAIATAISILLGDIVASSVLYKKINRISVAKLYQKILPSILLSSILPVLFFVPLLLKNNGVLVTSWIELFRFGIVYVALYAVFLSLFGMNKDDKKLIISRISR